MRGVVCFGVALLALFVFQAIPAIAAGGAVGPYSPPGLYHVEQLRLANGFRVLLKQRPQTRNVSLRLSVNVGYRHFDCKLRETPRILKHLLVSGTARHTEAEINGLIEGHGGVLSAKTGPRSTTYGIDIFDRYPDVGLEMLHELVAAPALTGKKIERAKNIVAQKLGGRPSFLRSVFYSLNAGKTAWTKANDWLLPGGGAVCRDLATPDAIGEKEIAGAFDSFYTPENMTLIVVGNFDWQTILDRVRRTFGTLPAPVATPADKTVHTPPYPADGPRRVTGTFAPFLGSSGSVAVAFRTDGADSPDAGALEVLSTCLDARLYEQVRVQKGLSYNPEASLFMAPDYGVLSVSADTSLGKIDRVSEALHLLLEGISALPPTAEEVAKTKQRMMFRWARRYETNAGIADFYIASLHRLNGAGRLRNYEREIERVTPADVARAVKTYLRPDRRVEVRSAPTLSLTGFYSGLGLVAVLAVFAVVRIARRMSRNERIPWYRR